MLDTPVSAIGSAPRGTQAVARVDAHVDEGIDEIEIPAFLCKQAD